MKKRPEDIKCCQCGGQFEPCETMVHFRNKIYCEACYAKVREGIE